MVLTEEQVADAYKFVLNVDAYGCERIFRLLAYAMKDKDIVVVNADW